MTNSKSHKSSLPVPFPPTLKDSIVQEIKGSYSFSLHLIKHHKILFSFMAAIFIFGILLAYITPNFIKMIFLEQMFAKFSGFGGSNTNLLVQIFFNNVRAAMYSLILGVFIILPMLMLFLNGYIIGIFLDFMNRASAIGVVDQPITFLIASLVPHGIIELPVMVFFSFISSLLGIKIIFGRYFEPAESRKSFLLKVIKSFLFVIIPLLFVAATIESFVSGTLVQGVQSTQTNNNQTLNSVFIQSEELKQIGLHAEQIQSESSGLQQDPLFMKYINLLMYDENNFRLFRSTKPESVAFRKYSLNNNTYLSIRIDKFKTEQDAQTLDGLFKDIMQKMQNNNGDYKVDMLSNSLYSTKYKSIQSYMSIDAIGNYAYTLSYNGKDTEILDKLIALQTGKIRQQTGSDKNIIKSENWKTYSYHNFSLMIPSDIKDFSCDEKSCWSMSTSLSTGAKIAFIFGGKGTLFPGQKYSSILNDLKNNNIPYIEQKLDGLNCVIVNESKGAFPFYDAAQQQHAYGYLIEINKNSGSWISFFMFKYQSCKTKCTEIAPTTEDKALFNHIISTFRYRNP